MKKIKRCLHCGAVITGRRSDADFCCDSCKAAHWLLSAEEKLLRKKMYRSGDDGVLTKEVGNSKQNKSPRPPGGEKQALPPFLNTISTSGESLSGTGKNNSNQFGETQTPEEFIIKKITQDNPVYLELKTKLKICKDDIKVHKKEVSRVQDLIKAELNRNGSGYVITSSALGAALAHELARPKQDYEEKKDTTLFWTLSGFLGGALIGKTIQSETEKSREAEKHANILKLQGELEKYQAELGKLTALEARYNVLLLITDPTITKEVKEKNPNYETELKQISNRNNLSGLETDKISSAKNISEMQFELLDFDGKWESFLGKPQTNFFKIIHGMSGSGKSHLALQIAVYLANRFGNVLYVSGEEGFAPTLQQKIKTMGADVPRLFFADLRTGKEILNSVANKYHFLIVDSVNNMGIDPAMMRAIRNKFKQSAIIGICQNTKAGELRGSYELMHDADISVNVAEGIATTEKNRFKATGEKFNVFDVYGSNKK